MFADNNSTFPNEITINELANLIIKKINPSLKTIKKSLPEEQITYIYDNEPRNREIIKQMYSVIDKGYSLVIWPDDLKHKDINDMIISGKTVSEIQTLISNNTHCGMTALQHINNWKRI